MTGIFIKIAAAVALLSSLAVDLVTVHIGGGSFAVMPGMCVPCQG